MKIDHIGILTKDLEGLKEFYKLFFNMKSSEKYVNHQRGFSSYFLSVDGGARMEIMSRIDVADSKEDQSVSIGLAHLAISVGSQVKVDAINEMMRDSGFTICSEPYTTGDGYYMCEVLDPDGNHIQIMAD